MTWGGLVRRGGSSRTSTPWNQALEVVELGCRAEICEPPTSDATAAPRTVRRVRGLGRRLLFVTVPVDLIDAGLPRSGPHPSPCASPQLPSALAVRPEPSSAFITRCPSPPPPWCSPPHPSRSPPPLSRRACARGYRRPRGSGRPRRQPWRARRVLCEGVAFRWERNSKKLWLWLALVLLPRQFFEWAPLLYQTRASEFGDGGLPPAALHPAAWPSGGARSARRCWGARCFICAPREPLQHASRAAVWVARVPVEWQEKRNNKEGCGWCRR
jgi:hypothetical protein